MPEWHQIVLLSGHVKASTESKKESTRYNFCCYLYKIIVSEILRLPPCNRFGQTLDLQKINQTDQYFNINFRHPSGQHKHGVIGTLLDSAKRMITDQKRKGRTKYYQESSPIFFHFNGISDIRNAIFILMKYNLKAIALLCCFLQKYNDIPLMYQYHQSCSMIINTIQTNYN